MSNFFSCIVTQKAEVLFCELDAHDEIVYRSGLSDDLTQFLRVVYNFLFGKSSIRSINSLMLSS
jgi:hypothetical protein